MRNKTIDLSTDCKRRTLLAQDRYFAHEYRKQEDKNCWPSEDFQLIACLRPHRRSAMVSVVLLQIERVLALRNTSSIDLGVVKFHCVVAALPAS
jgi:hypothetical protein